MFEDTRELHHGDIKKMKMLDMYRQMSLSQWERTLQGNVIAHWLSPYPDLFLQYSVLVETQHAEASSRVIFI